MIEMKNMVKEKETWKGVIPELKELLVAWDSAGMRVFLYIVLAFVFVVVVGMISKMFNLDVMQIMVQGIVTAVALAIGNIMIVDKFLRKNNKVDELEKKVNELENKLKSEGDKYDKFQE